MDEKRARALLRAERSRVESLLRDAETARHEDSEAQGDIGDTADHAQELTAEGVDEALVTGLKDRLAALDRAEGRLANGTFARSVRTGEPIPDDRLEADPAAELTVEEARSRP